jgi:O-antigen ligase
VGVVGLASVPFLYRQPGSLRPAKRRARKIDWRYGWAIIAILGLALLSIVLSRSEALNRLLGRGEGEEVRLDVWRPIFRAAQTYFPIGSGIGTFATAYQIHEPTSTLRWFYMNHAHNEWLELFMTGGLPALILMAGAIGCWGIVALRWFLMPLGSSRKVAFGRLGSILIFMLAVASTADYPMRVPSLACLFVIAAVWMAGMGKSEFRGFQKNAGTA